MGNALHGRLVLACVIGCLAGTAGADGLTRYKCRIAFDGQSRGHFSETMSITVQDPAWTVLVDDDLIQSAVGQPVEAVVRAKKPDRIEFEWNIPLKKKGVGGKMKTNFRMTILTSLRLGSLSTSWGTGYSFRTFSAQGTCKEVKG